VLGVLASKLWANYKSPGGHFAFFVIESIDRHAQICSNHLAPGKCCSGTRIYNFAKSIVINEAGVGAMFPKGVRSGEYKIQARKV
jgi:hypothetical protein